MNKLLGWLPVISVAAVTLIAWGALTTKVSALDDEQKAARLVIERSIANEARIDANVRIIANQGTQIQRAQQDVRAAVEKIDRTQNTLNTQQLEIIRLLNRTR